MEKNRQAKLQFEQCKVLKLSKEDASPTGAGPDASGPELGSELLQILLSMQLSLTKIDSKFDSLPYCMDRMSVHLDKHVEHLDTVEQHVSTVDDEWAVAADVQKNLEKAVLVLQAKDEELEGHSRSVQRYALPPMRLYVRCVHGLGGRHSRVDLQAFPTCPVVM
ncbi:hypothetical protein NDU88_001472 [Pleurodeles waltl]|uniref:Uncharacterized protein n=1 Tax=Pleurodeles waltl TaxID=8319 RepID=A0AAV7R8P9_PLEWA|nr:hypothetical protein NDU88_001472 [Pleurodeles waltl]